MQEIIEVLITHCEEGTQIEEVHSSSLVVVGCLNHSGNIASACS